MLFIHKLRAVPEHQRALAVGTNGFAASLSGTWQNILKTSSGDIFDFSLSLVKTTVAFQTSLKTVCGCRCLHTKPFSLMVNPTSMFSTDCSRRCSSQLLLISLISCMVCVFSGFLIGPLVYGRLIDTFCQHWRSPCGATGACSVYNLQRFRVNLHLYTVAAMILGLLLDVVGFLILKYGKRFVPSEVLHANTEPKPDAVAMPTNINADTNDHMENSGAEFHSNAAEEGLEMLPKNTPGKTGNFD